MSLSLCEVDFCSDRNGKLPIKKSGYGKKTSKKLKKIKKILDIK